MSIFGCFIDIEVVGHNFGVRTLAKATKMIVCVPLLATLHTKNDNNTAVAGTMQATTQAIGLELSFAPEIAGSGSELCLVELCCVELAPIELETLELDPIMLELV